MPYSESRMVDHLFDRALKASPHQRQGLDRTTLGKTGHLARPASHVSARSTMPSRTLPTARMVFGGLPQRIPPTKSSWATHFPAPSVIDVHPQSTRDMVMTRAAEGSAPVEYPKGFRTRQLVGFAFMVIGYSSYYVTRNSLYFTAPEMVKAGVVADITTIGVITSVFPLFYGCSKFVSGVVSDRLSPRTMLSLGLFLTGVMNLAFGASNTLLFFCLTWGMNGILQGFGAPCCSKLITAWFATKERGTFWGLWNIAHNLGATSAPLIAGTAARSLGWRFGTIVPGIIGMVVSAIVFTAVRDSPESVGYPPVEEKKKEEKKGEEPTEKVSVLENLRTKVLTNWKVVTLAFTFLMVYLVRQGLTSWLVFYLMAEKGAKDVAAAAATVTGMELGGLVGSLLAGRLSDYMINTAKPGQGFVGRRVLVCQVYMLGVAAALTSLWFVPATSIPLQWFAIFMVGFFLYGPQMMVGLMGAEVVPTDTVGASQGFLGWIAYLGAAFAGLPLSILVKQYGWQVFFQTLVTTCFLATALLTTLNNVKSNAQLEAEKR
eukprot:gnl/TRDRNA2_/TRDRNA2_170895_c1_seq1.p1 gnl/TRDRNA2_/TRDRNA2_170895_c1~~gnl/TRDRNA2_/TRDRNA2_170895_c1_seq1.p1  ORF type:complete len:608 (+),score=88.40 gnl/TRDRNA2_/TRDRNA2_170895_c1_seq1:192-1826(+)